MVGGAGMNANRPVSFDWWEQGEDFFSQMTIGLADHDLDGPTLLEGWMRRTVIAHVARWSVVRSGQECAGSHLASK